MPRAFPAATLFAAVFVAISGCEDQAAPSAGHSRSVPEATGFDFFVLALSWSPSYCASTGDRANRQQCGPDKRFGFVVHGLWPQFTQGYPTACETELPLSVPRTLSDSMLDIMPSTGLVRHEWATHGTCSGVSQEDYFALTRMAFERVSVPPQFRGESAVRAVDPAAVEAAFTEANPGLASDAIAVTCDRRYLRDIRICMARDLDGFVACPEVDGDACPRDSAVMPPVRH